MKGKHIGVVLITLAVLAALAASMACAGEEEEENTVAQQTQPPSQPTLAATPAGPRLIGGAYKLVPALESATYDRMVGFSMIPDAGDAAVLLTQGGVIWRLSLSEDSPATVFGDVSDRIIERPGNEEGLLGLAFSPSFDVDRRVYLTSSWRQNV